MSSKLNAQDRQAVSEAVAAERKRSYVSPQLRRLGSVRELTLGLTTGAFEIGMMGA